MSRTSSLLLAGAVLAAALAPAAVAGAAPQGKADKAKAEHERIVAYWTPERMKAAKPRDFERLPDGSFRQVKPAKGANANKGGKPGGGPVVVPPTPAFPAAGESTGEFWSKGGEVDARTGKVYFTSGSWGYVCSGAVADDDNSERALVLTAGHCLYDNEKTSRKRPPAGFVSNWLFVPDYTEGQGFLRACSDANQDCWTAEALVVHKGFANAGGFTSTATLYDFGFAVVTGETPLDASPRGSYGIDTVATDEWPKVGNNLSAFGYPAADPYDGQRLTYCQGPIGTDARNSDRNWSMYCNMTGGSSGGPWLNGMDSSGDGGVLSSLNSYGYSGEPYMYGPKFNDTTKKVWDEAKAQAAHTTPVNTVVG